MNEEEPYFSPQGTTMPRHIAGLVDNVVACVLAVIAAKQVDAENIPMQAVLAISAYLGYYFVFEILTSRSLGKLLTGLKIVDFDGNRCSIKQVTIRTLFRLIEVNPFLLGALPAAIRIIWSRNKQRFGDKFANTVVVRG
ncbi:MAG: RDD family protein [Planctomycetota bacterium]